MRGGTVQESLKTYYQAYRLVKASEPHYEREWLGVWDSYRGKRNESVHGRCQLKLAAEGETIDGLLEAIPAMEIYFQNMENGKNIVMKPFWLCDGEEVEYFDYRFGGGHYFRNLDRERLLLPECDFRMIYRTYDRSMVIIMDSWLAGNIEELSMKTVVKKGENRSKFWWYDVEFMG